MEFIMRTEQSILARLSPVFFTVGLFGFETKPARADQFMASMPLTIRVGIEADFPSSTRIDAQHVDVELPYRAGGNFEQLFEGDVVGLVPGSQGHLYGNTLTRVTMPTNPSFSFIGAAPGEQIWVLPQSSLAGRVFAGIAAETQSSSDVSEMLAWNPGDPRGSASSTAKWLEVNLLDVRGPAGSQFSLWQTGSGGAGLTQWVSTFENGIDPEDQYYLTANAHTHVNWGFTKAGLYEIDVQLRTRTNLSWIVGDADRDQDVDLDDFNILVENFGKRRDWFHADFTGDGLVDLDDFFGLEANFGFGTGGLLGPGDFAAALSASGLLAPEPAGAFGLLAIAVAACRRR
jgi:surface-anchored protein